MELLIVGVVCLVLGAAGGVLVARNNPKILEGIDWLAARVDVLGDMIEDMNVPTELSDVKGFRARPVSGQNWIEDLLAFAEKDPHIAIRQLENMIRVQKGVLVHFDCDPDDIASVDECRWARFPSWVERLLGYYAQIIELQGWVEYVKTRYMPG